MCQLWLNLPAKNKMDLTFEEFLLFLKETTEETGSQEQLLQSFAHLLAGGGC